METSSPAPSKALRISLWVVQGLLALVFTAAGLTKLFTPYEELTQMMTWTADLSPFLLKFIGTAEVLGALGLIVPALTRIRPRLVSAAALGLVTVMTLAALFHLFRGEYTDIIRNVVIGAFAFFVAWGRTRKAPFQPRA